MEKQIANIVLYLSHDEEGKEVKKSAVFYNDGTVVEGTYDFGIETIKSNQRQLNIKTNEDLKRMFKEDKILHTLTQEDFTKRFNSFIVNPFTAEEEKNKAVNETPVEEPTTSPAEDETNIVADDETDEESKDEIAEEDEYIPDGIEDATDEIEDPELVNEDSKPKKEGFFKRLVKKISKKVAARSLAITTAAVTLLGLSGCEARLGTKEGRMSNSQTATTATTATTGTTTDNNNLYTGNNINYSSYETDNLLSVTRNNVQKVAMKNARAAINSFNGDFASAYVEEGKNIRAALTFEEVMALQQAYNDYSKDEIRAIFNGAEVDAIEMSRAYKDASLQLMSAYVIENNEHPVDMSMLVNSTEGKAFYKKYHEMFLAAKAATTYEEKAIKVSEFYKAVREDFPITQEIRTEGIAHADAYKTIESYKLAVTPMIAAAEMMYQNLKTDVTLNDSEIDFMNDIGLCNYADDKFEKIETITLSATEDKTNPTYTQFLNSIIAEQYSKSQYGIKDEERDLSQLDSFKRAVNWHFEIIGEGSYEEKFETYTTYETYTDSKTTYRTKEERVEKPITPEAKKQIDDKIAAENAKAKADAEKVGENKRQELQKEADKKSEQVREEIKKENEDLQKNIDKANEQINKNHDNDPTNDKPVNQNDLGHGVQFDNEHSDGNGNLDNSVENITVDPQGAVKHDDPLPNPNETGAKFDAQAGTFYGANGYEFSGQVYEYNVPTSYEEVVDTYVENLAGTEYDDEGYQYTYSN